MRFKLLGTFKRKPQETNRAACRDSEMLPSQKLLTRDLTFSPRPACPDLTEPGPADGLTLDLMHKIIHKVEMAGGMAEAVKLRQLSQAWKTAFLHYPASATAGIDSLKHIRRMLPALTSLTVNAFWRPYWRPNDVRYLGSFTRLTSLSIEGQTWHPTLHITDLSHMPPSLRVLSLQGLDIVAQNRQHLEDLGMGWKHITKFVCKNLGAEKPMLLAQPASYKLMLQLLPNLKDLTCDLQLDVLSARNGYARHSLQGLTRLACTPQTRQHLVCSLDLCWPPNLQELDIHFQGRTSELNQFLGSFTGSHLTYMGLNYEPSESSRRITEWFFECPGGVKSLKLKGLPPSRVSNLSALESLSLRGPRLSQMDVWHLVKTSSTLRRLELSKEACPSNWDHLVGLIGLRELAIDAGCCQGLEKCLEGLPALTKVWLESWCPNQSAASFERLEGWQGEQSLCKAGAKTLVWTKLAK